MRTRAEIDGPAHVPTGNYSSLPRVGLGAFGLTMLAEDDGEGSSKLALLLLDADVFPDAKTAKRCYDVLTTVRHGKFISPLRITLPGSGLRTLRYSKPSSHDSLQEHLDRGTGRHRCPVLTVF